MHKVITFGIPSYNAAKDMDHCITSILEGSNYATDIEIIVVDDGSKDETAAKADEWEARYPGIIRAVHQENGGHGIAVLSGLREAHGTYYKVVDSDDWLDGAALSTMLSILRGFEERDQRVDLFISNYVYEKVYEGTHTAIGYKFALPRKKIFSWDQIGHFRPDQNLLMHSLCYADIDLYRYFIGREGQSVNEATMVKRLGQQFRVTRIMMESFHLYQDVESSRLRSYMMGYFTMMMAICSVLTKLSEEDCADERLKTLWKDLKAYDERIYRRARYGVIGFFTNLRGRAGDKTTLGLYHLASKIFKFN